MKTPKYTPGPWHSEPYGPNLTLVTDAFNGAFAAEIEGPNRIADARLIAAAPDLLEALQACYVNLDAALRGVVNPANDIEVANMARAALEKALGAK
jgi:hypothetical protein